MTTAVMALGAQLPQWLEWLLQQLPITASVASSSRPPEELRPLIDISRDALGARDLSDVHSRLDTAILRLRSLPPFPLSLSELESHLQALPQDAPDESLAAHSLGMNVARKMLRGMRDSVRVLQILGTVETDPDLERRTILARALRITPWSIHDGVVVPHELVNSAIIQARGAIAVGALLAACVDGRQPEPWLSNALADAYLAAVREWLRLLGSAGYETMRLRDEERLNLAALFQEAEEADRSFIAAMEQDIRSGNVGIPEDD